MEIFIVFLLAMGLVSLVGLVRFCVADASLRGKSPLLVCLAAVVFFPWGLFAWLVFRPEPIQPFQLDDHRLQ
jgi:hypothetical protein